MFRSFAGDQEPVESTMSLPCPRTAFQGRRVAERYPDMSTRHLAATTAAGRTPGSPLVSCVMATVSGRGRFLRQAVKYFLRQTQVEKELIVVGEIADSFNTLFPGEAPIRHLPTSAVTNLGDKLNRGIEAARGTIIQKLDDDDYYHPEFLAAMVSAVEGSSPKRVLAAIDCCPVLITQTGDLKWTGHGRFAGGTLCFPKQLWRQCPFRDVPKDVDRWFLEDHDAERVRVCRPGLYIYVRHSGMHLWTHRGDQDVVEYYLQQPNFRQPLEELVAPDDVRFYRELQTLEPSLTGS